MPWKRHSASILSSRFGSRRDALNRMKPDRIIKRKIPVTDPQQQMYTVKNASVCTEKKQTLIKMIVHVADAVENLY